MRFLVALGFALFGCTAIPQRQEPNHPVFDYPKYDFSICENTDVDSIPSEIEELSNIAQSLIGLATTYNSTPSYIFKIMNIAEQNGVSNQLFLYGFENFVDSINELTYRRDPVVATYSADYFEAFVQWKNALDKLTAANKINERNEQAKNITGIPISMSSKWYKFLYANWQVQIKNTDHQLPTDEEIIYAATISICKNIETIK